MSSLRSAEFPAETDRHAPVDETSLSSITQLSVRGSARLEMILRTHWLPTRDGREHAVRRVELAVLQAQHVLRRRAHEVEEHLFFFIRIRIF